MHAFGQPRLGDGRDVPRDVAQAMQQRGAKGFLDHRQRVIDAAVQGAQAHAVSGQIERA